ncbi:sensor histidine kinase [Deinococcus koreensis]|uniref:histidine kinase n=1 Tax=Deinococcus koreensis TaxID=2054903 RepID=A0A2K3UXD4_9DEIO|nr:HAMP domain-containing sensor histidine kinase [Deinococcus koreensis]PNY81188.1 sensor histidine kinase [Deinococcus koreensis]
MRLTLRARLALWAALATGVAVVLVAAGLFIAVNTFLRQAQVERLLSATSAVQDRVENALNRPPDELGLDELLSGTLSQQELERISDADPQTRNMELRLVRVGPRGQIVTVTGTPRFPPNVPVNLRVQLYQSGTILIADRVLRGGNAILTVVTDARVLGDAQRAFTRALTWLLPLALLISLAVGWTVAGRLLRPVRTLENAARTVGDSGDLRRPLPGAGQGDELSRLALTLQGSFTRLADARDREQAFLRAAAHDLRSPLTALTARVEGTLAYDRDAERYRADLREIGTDITRLSTLANHLLLLARDPAALGRAPVPLRDLAADAVDRARELAPDADVDLHAPQEVTVSGDRILLGQAIWNLTTNAVRHAPGATVSVRVDTDGGLARVTVHDDGPGVPAGVLARLGEAFYRPEESRSGEGHGLGLALARRAAELHGGTLRLESAEGQGFTATLEVPVERRAVSEM